MVCITERDREQNVHISRPKPGIPATAPFPLLPLHVQNPPTMRLPSPGSLPAPHSVSASLRFGSHEAVRALALRSVLGVPWAQHRGAVSTACVSSRGTAPRGWNWSAFPQFRASHNLVAAWASAKACMLVGKRSPFIHLSSKHPKKPSSLCSLLPFPSVLLSFLHEKPRNPVTGRQLRSQVQEDSGAGRVGPSASAGSREGCARTGVRPVGTPTPSHGLAGRMAPAWKSGNWLPRHSPVTPQSPPPPHCEGVLQPNLAAAISSELCHVATLE